MLSKHKSDSPMRFWRLASTVSVGQAYFTRPSCCSVTSQRASKAPPLAAVFPSCCKMVDMRLLLSKPMGSHFGVGAPPILVYLSGDWDVHWLYGILTHGHKRHLRRRGSDDREGTLRLHWNESRRLVLARA